MLLAPWKTASQTCKARLGRLNQSPYSPFYEFNSQLKRVVHQHIVYSDFAALPEGKLGYFTGAFVRNPYDRVYSGFLQLQRDIQMQPRAAFPDAWTKEMVMRQLAENYAQLAAGEFQFDNWFALVREHQIYEVGRNSSFPLHPCHYWTGAERENSIDFIGKVENFDADFASFCDKVGVVLEVSQDKNVSNLSQAAEKAGPYRYTKIMNSASIEKIEHLFAHDFDIFNYPKFSAAPSVQV